VLEYVPGYRYILSGHRENYFISGVTAAQHTVKFQYSVKFDLWPNATRHSLYFAFSQKSLWRLWDFSASSPIVESNYAPEVFYGYYSRIGDLPPQPGRVIPFLDRANVGFEHESNGQDGATSRGWNRINGSIRGGLYLGLDHYIAVTPRGWLPPFGKADNPKITDYLGFGSLSFEYGYDPSDKAWWGGGNLGATVWKAANKDLSRGAIEAWLNWRPAYEGKFVKWWKFTPYLYVQGYFGYGETLLQYDRSVSSIRVGFALEDKVNWVTIVRR